MIPSAKQGPGGKQPAVFTEGHEDDAVHELLRHTDRHVEGLLVSRTREFGNEFEALLVIVGVQFIADFALAFLGLLQQHIGTGHPFEAQREQPGALEEAIEVEEGVPLAQVLQGEKLIHARRLLSVVEAEAHDVRHDAPGAIGHFSQIIPALLDRRAPIELVPVDVDLRAFELDDGPGRYVPVGFEETDGGVGRLIVEAEFGLEVPLRLPFGKKGVA
jgi:hypothetical protein